MSYDVQRQWADQYTPQLNQITTRIILSDPKLIGVNFIKPSLHEDRKLGIDMWIDVQKTKVSHRVREAKYLNYFLQGFTIRTAAKSGESELQKLMRDDYADFLLYAIAHPDNYGEVDCAILIDLKSVGAQLQHFPHIANNATKKNGFIDFNYDAFPSSIICGTWNVKETTACH